MTGRDRDVEQRVGWCGQIEIDECRGAATTDDDVFQTQVATIGPDGPLAETNWAKQRLGRATQALPNGFCGLPAVKTCPQANACWTCPMFVTTPQFLPQHREHRQQVTALETEPGSGEREAADAC